MSSSPEPVAPSIGSPTPLRVLLVDDVAMNRRMSEMLLKHLGCEVITTEGVAAALEQIRAHEFDWILTDLEMPDVHGFEALELFRKADQGARPERRKRLKIMAVSGGQVGMTHQDYLAAGFDEYLAKPVEVERLRSMLQCQTSGKATAPAAPPPVLDNRPASGSLQITKPLDLTDQQLAQVDLHSFLNILNILLGELQLLTLELGDSAALGETIRLGGEVLHLVREGQLDEEASRKATSLQATFLKEWSAVARRATELANRAAPRQSAANLDSILKVLIVRLAEYQERQRSGLVWCPHNIRQLTDNFVNFFAALEKNSKGRYHIIYNIAAQDAADYLVSFRIESVDGDTLRMPPVLQDVFRDLIANARKYTPPGGHITAGLHDNGTELRMAVEDTGCGIPAEEIERVVEFGYRASNVREKATRGGGFGLTKAYHVTCKLGGSMWIASTLGKGTRVTVHIPHPAR